MEREHHHEVESDNTVEEKPTSSTNGLPFFPILAEPEGGFLLKIMDNSVRAAQLRMLHQKEEVESGEEEVEEDEDYDEENTEVDDDDEEAEDDDEECVVVDDIRQDDEHESDVKVDSDDSDESNDSDSAERREKLKRASKARRDQSPDDEVEQKKSKN